MISKFYITFILWISSCFLYAQQTQLHQLPAKRFKLNTLNYEQGLQSNTVNNILTDSEGFLWVATETGLQRYNGYTFEPIQPIIDGKKVIVNYTVNLFLLNNKHLWITTKDGILDFNPEKQQFEYVIKNEVSKSNFIQLPLAETKDAIWFIDDEKGICIYNKITSQVEIVFASINASFIHQFFIRQDVGSFNKGSNLKAIFNNIIYIASSNSILHINTETRKYHFLKNNFENIFSLVTNQNKLLIATKSKITIIDPTTEAEIKNIGYSNFESKIINRVYLQKMNNYYILSLNNNLFEIDTNFVNYKICTAMDNAPLLNVGYINTIYTDVFQRIWLITNNDIKRIQYNQLPFKHFFYSSTKNNFIKSIFYNENTNQIIAGSYGGGLQMYDSIGTNLLPVPLQTEAIKDIMNIIETSKNQYLITPYLNKWQSINTVTKQISPINISSTLDTIIASTKVNFINNLKKIDDSHYIIATSKNIFNCKIENNKLLEALPIFDFLPNDDNYLVFLQTTKNTIWTGTRSGKLFLKDANGVVKNIENIGNYFIRSACEDSTGNIWIGTDKGLHIYTSKGDLFKSFTTSNGLRNDCIYAILPVENKATVFVSTNLGLSQVDIDGSIKNYSKEIGLQENEFNTGAAFKTQSGKLFFGGINGITAFYPNSLNETENNLQLHLSRLVINDSIYSYPSSIWKNDTINLENYQNHLQFDLVANGVLNANEYNYQYRIVGFEENWQSTNNPVNIRYTLQPNKYFLEIICTPILSNGQKFTKKIMINIRPAWYQIVWVQLLILLGILSIVGAFVYQYQRIIYLRKIKELQIQNELQKDRERISRELHDNLGTQLSYISSNTDFILDIDERLSNTDRNLKLKKINTIAKESIADLRETIWALKKGAISLEELSERIKLFANEHANNVNVEFKEKIISNESLSSVDTLNIFRLCQEAISNAMKYANATIVQITISSNQTFQYHIEISDDGIGFNPNKIIGEHYGLENMKIRAKELNAIFNIKSKENEGTIITLYKENQKSV